MSLNVKDCVHIFVCNNQKSQGKCCANENTNEIFDFLKKSIADNLENLNPDLKYKVVKTSCLGRCSLGPNIFISPDNVWYKYSSQEDVNKIINQHLINGEIVHDLLHR